MSERIVIHGVDNVSGRKLLLDLADKIRMKWSGELRISLQDGGVRDAEQTEKWTPRAGCEDDAA